MKHLWVRKEDSVTFKALIVYLGYLVVSHHILSSCCRNKIKKCMMNSCNSDPNVRTWANGALGTDVEVPERKSRVNWCTARWRQNKATCDQTDDDTPRRQKRHADYWLDQYTLYIYIMSGTEWGWDIVPWKLQANLKGCLLLLWWNYVLITLHGSL